MVHGILLGRVPPSAVEDLVQDVFLRAMPCVGSLRDVGHFGGWLAAIARNRAYSLSGGERRRVEIARSLAINPAFILLDEPFAGIDPIAVFEIQRIVSQLRARGIGILITDHNVRETLKITDRAYIIKEGEIFRQGAPEMLSADAEVRRIYLGESFNLS